MDVHKIAKNLDRYQWRDLQAILNRRTFHYDIIGELPIEILLIIFSHLDLVAPFRLQRVSRKWYEKLSSPDILDASLAQWYSRFDPSLLGEAGKTEHELRQLKLEHVQRFRTGNFSSYAEIKFSNSDRFELQDHIAQNRRDFAGSKIAWCKNRDSRVTVLDLDTNDSFYVHGLAREVPADVMLSQELLLLVTLTTTQYVCDLKTRERRSFKLPSNSIRSWGITGRTVVFLMDPSQDDYGIIIWNFDSRKTRIFKLRSRPTSYEGPALERNNIVKEECIMNPETLLLSDESDTITVLFYRAEGVLSIIGCEKYGFSGALVQSCQDFLQRDGSFIQRDYPFREHNVAINFWNIGKTMHSYEGHFNICFAQDMGIDKGTHTERMRMPPSLFRYNYNTMEFLVLNDFYDQTDYIEDDFIREANLEENLYELKRWKSISFDPFVRNFHPLDKNLDHSRGFLACIYHKSWLPGDKKGLDLSGRQWPSNLYGNADKAVPHNELYLNDRYVVCFIRQSILVWAFDPDVDLDRLRHNFCPSALKTNPLECAWSEDD